MNNNIFCIGRIKDIINITSDVCRLLITTPRSYKNQDGIYDNDYIEVTLRGMICTNVLEHCKEGDMIGVKGHIERTELDMPMYLIADKVTFLSSTFNKNNKEEN